MARLLSMRTLILSDISVGNCSHTDSLLSSLSVKGKRHAIF